MSLFRSAITEADGVSVNVGYLSLFWIMIVVLSIVPIMVGAACVQAYYDDRHTFPFAELGKGAGLVTAAFAAALAALGGFIWGDRSGTPQQVTVTASTGPTITTTTGAPNAQPPA